MIFLYISMDGLFVVYVIVISCCWVEMYILMLKLMNGI